ncbi:MAG: hypothetical protein J6S31_06095 [Lachnospiraceae bacterium]|nr:hypothetical protein [Lachnospiraceae bacterium]
MSIVRYTNKKTGIVTLYESTSHYDPVTKQSRPVRKYLGIEDPNTGELIPSTGKRGRKGNIEKEPSKEKKVGPDYQLLYEQQKKECIEKDREIRELRNRNKVLYSDLERLKDIIEKMLVFTSEEEKR